MKATLFVELVLGCWLPLTLGVEVKVLFVGNSYTYVNDLPAAFKSVARSLLPDVTVTTTQSTVGGLTLHQHASNAGTQAAVNDGDYDIMVLQEQSQTGGFYGWYPTYTVRELAVEALDTFFIPAAKKRNASIVFYETWGRMDGDPDNPGYWPWFTLMQCAVSNGYSYMLYYTQTKLCSVLLAPVGQVFEHAFMDAGGTWVLHEVSEDSTFSRLYSSDKSHPSQTGTFAAALTLFATIFQDRRSEWLAQEPVVPAGIRVDDAEKVVRIVRNLTAPLRPQLAALQGHFVGTGNMSGLGHYINWRRYGQSKGCENRYLTIADDGSVQIPNSRQRIERIEDVGFGIRLENPNLGYVVGCVVPETRFSCNGRYWADCQSTVPVDPPCHYDTYDACIADENCTATLFTKFSCAPKPAVAPVCETLYWLGLNCTDYACVRQDLAPFSGYTCTSICRRFNEFPEQCERAVLEGSNGHTLTCSYDAVKGECEQLTPLAKNDCSYDDEDLCALMPPCAVQNGTCVHACTAAREATLEEWALINPGHCGWDPKARGGKGRSTLPLCIKYTSEDECLSIVHCTWRRGQCWARDSYSEVPMDENSCSWIVDEVDMCNERACAAIEVPAYGMTSCSPAPWVVDTAAPPTPALLTVPPSSEVSQTSIPATGLPAAYSTMAPVTAEPATNPPVAPSTPTPKTLFPATLAPSTLPPVTQVPRTTAPVVAVPHTNAPGVIASTTAPKSSSPATLAPSTSLPVTQVPRTTAPAAAVPHTNAPTVTSEPPTVLSGAGAADETESGFPWWAVVVGAAVAVLGLLGYLVCFLQKKIKVATGYDEHAENEEAMELTERALVNEHGHGVWPARNGFGHVST